MPGRRAPPGTCAAAPTSRMTPTRPRWLPRRAPPTSRGCPPPAAMPCGATSCRWAAGDGSSKAGLASCTPGAAGCWTGSLIAPVPPCLALLTPQELRLLAPGEVWRVSVRGTGHDLLAVSPVLEAAACGVAAAPIGLTNMLNAGGAVLAAELAGGRSILAAESHAADQPAPRPPAALSHRSDAHCNAQRRASTAGGLPRCACSCAAPAASCSTPRAAPQRCCWTASPPKGWSGRRAAAPCGSWCPGGRTWAAGRAPPWCASRRCEL